MTQGRGRNAGSGASGGSGRAGAGAAGRPSDPRVVPAKVRVPTPRLDVVARPRLLDRLRDEDGRVVLISAPAGSGKTVLVLDWLRRDPRPVAWLSLDPLDNDPQRFLAHLAAALRAAPDPALGPAADAVEAASRSGATSDPALLAALAAADPRTALVLDDIHHLDAPPLLALLDRLVAERSTGPRLVLLSRVDPAVRLGRIRLSGELLEIRQRDLRFTLPEATELLRSLLPEELDPELVARLETRTEGWAAGLRMAAAALDRVEDPAAAVAAFTGSHEIMAEYLLEEAVGRQDPDLQRFLMETSILPRFTAEACVAVTESEAAGSHLRAVDEANLFLVSLDDRRRWYRYHHLFAELLEFRLQRLLPERVEGLRDRASRWFEAEGDVQEALRQAAEMEGRGRLLDILDRHGYPILARSEFGAFARWLPRVPEPLSQPFPMFLVALAWFRSQTERAPDLDALLRAIEAAVEKAPADYPAERRQEALLHVDALRAFALRMTDRFEEAIEVGAGVLRRLPPDAGAVRAVLEFNLGAVHLRLADMGPAREHLERAFDGSLRSGIPYLVLASLGHLGAVAAQTEGVGPARQRLEGAVAFAEENRLAGLPAFAIVLYQLAHVHWLADELEPARACLERAVALTRDERETDIHANVLIHLARLDAAAGAFDRADQRLTAVTALAHGHNVKPFATTLDVERARLAEARSGQLQPPPFDPPSDPAGALADAEPPPWGSPREAETVLRLRHCLRLGLRDDAAALARELARASAPRGRGVALCLADLGLAATATDARERHEALEAALSRAARCGYVRPLLEVGEPARALITAGLSAAPLSGPARSFARELLARFPEPAAPDDAVDAADPLDTLTDRERELLALLARGHTNKAMARELFVSVNTVKTHLKRIFAKLDVTTRTEAAERARALGLLDDGTAAESRS